MMKHLILIVALVGSTAGFEIDEADQIEIAPSSPEPR